MDEFRALLTDIWREACRHIEIERSAASFAAMLDHHLPLDQIIFLRLDSDHRRVVRVASVPQREGTAALQLEPCNARDWKRFVAWANAADIIRRGSSRGLSSPLDRVLRIESDSDILVAPLCASTEPVGLVLLTARSKCRFEAKHVALVAVIREPLAVALENDRRLHEMAALREAAEADKLSLLNRLGRTEIADTIVGDDAGLRQVLERVRLVCRSDVPVLILGETGTGKELIARAIHARSDRHSGPFIRVNCGAIPSELIDSHLFGHERGSFTGAADSRPGWFERASGGTMFLAEIGELPLGAQVRFLRVLQDGLVERVGGEQSIHVDVRIVAATHRDLYSMVRDARFREDLWYRINVFPILLPPLRERRSDIQELARHFARRAATRFGLAPVEPSQESIAQLEAYSWPGNIRELAAVIDRAAILGEGRSLEVATALGLSGRPPSSNSDAANKLVRPDGQSHAITQPVDHGSVNSTSTFLSLDQAMSKHIKDALHATRGRIEGPHGAAALLRINPHTLRARMRKLKIDWSTYRT
jgi:transcriptional regulator with GAF, ATPase, and Fis domain